MRTPSRSDLARRSIADLRALFRLAADAAADASADPDRRSAARAALDLIAAEIAARPRGP